MKFSIFSFVGALMPIAAVAAPVVLASSSTASTAQTLPALDPVPLMAPPPPEPPVPTPAAVTPSDPGETGPDARHVECIAKVILHEAADEPRHGRVAVAQVIRARIRDGRFADDACAVTRQRGQFFNVDAFQPSRATPAWADAMAIATATLSGEGDEVVPGALFFHAAWKPMRGRQRVGQVGGHVFYR